MANLTISSHGRPKPARRAVLVCSLALGIVSAAGLVPTLLGTQPSGALAAPSGKDAGNVLTFDPIVLSLAVHEGSEGTSRRLRIGIALETEDLSLAEANKLQLRSAMVAAARTMDPSALEMTGGLELLKERLGAAVGKVMEASAAEAAKSKKKKKKKKKKDGDEENSAHKGAHQHTILITDFILL